MSRSIKKPYYKDNAMTTHEYWSPIRHEWKQKLKQNYYEDDFELRDSKSIINDYDYCDYSLFIQGDIDEEKRGTFGMTWTKEEEKKASRK